MAIDAIEKIKQREVEYETANTEYQHYSSAATAFGQNPQSESIMTFKREGIENKEKAELLKNRAEGRKTKALGELEESRAESANLEKNKVGQRLDVLA